MTTQDPTFAEAMAALGLPEAFASRSISLSDAVRAIMAVHDEVRDGGRAPRKYATPLLLSIVVQVELWLLDAGQARHDGSLEVHRSETDQNGQQANQLVMTGSSGSFITLRPIFNRLETLVVGTMQRLGFPSGPGYATGQWRRFQPSLDVLAAMSPEERRTVAGELWTLIEAFDRQELSTGRERVPRPFGLLLDTFEPRQRGENEGALLQGLAYAYYRADAPNIDLDSGRSRAGGARANRIGDIDGYSGNELVLTIEVKDAEVRRPSADRFNDWLLKLPPFPNALAVALARDFDAAAAGYLEERGAVTLDVDTMRRTVALWDLGKQQLAIRGFWFYLNRIEREPRMMARFDRWCDEHGVSLWFSGRLDSPNHQVGGSPTDDA